jgi:hypothetical protein
MAKRDSTPRGDEAKAALAANPLRPSLMALVITGGLLVGWVGFLLWLATPFEG